MKKPNKWTYVLSFLLVFVLCINFSIPAFAEENSNTIHIKTVDDLLALAKDCRLDTWSQNKSVVLDNDIFLADTFVSIPSFGGTFNGNGHTISGLDITDSVSPSGLFGQLQINGVIKNLNVSGTVAPTGDAATVGGIVGENNGLIENCTFEGNIAGKENCGSIAGINAMTGIIRNSTANSVIFGENKTGGICGYNLGLIENCENNSLVNITSVDPSISLDDINFDFLTDFSKITSLDTSAASNDTGGIAGYSSGMIINSDNHGKIGYPHIGYNVGGIAGRSCGYIHDCTNTAEIYGRKEIGGIVGQMEPYINMELSEDILSTLKHQLDELNGMINNVLDDTDTGVNTITNRLNNIVDYLDEAASAAENISTYGSVTSTVVGGGESGGSGSVTVTPPQIEIGGEGENGGNIEFEVSPGSGSGEGSNYGEDSIHGGLTESGIDGSGESSINCSVNADTQIHLNTSLHGLSSAINGMSNQMLLLNKEISGNSGAITEDLRAISNQINTIGNTLSDAVLSVESTDILEDSSLNNIDLITLGKVSSCINSGTVYGDINIGGITGAMAIEYTLDPEDDISESLSGSQRSKFELKSVIQNCENTGSVTAKRNYVGGICGKMDLGFITLAENYAPLESENGDYVGGIAGITGGTIQNCFSKCTLKGRYYIGGIVGSGIQESSDGNSSTVSGCYSIVEIPHSEQYIGAISGTEAGVFLENYFVSEELAGINRLSYSGHAEPILFEKIHEQSVMLKDTQGIDIPKEFQTLSLRFVIDGVTVKEESFEYGASFSEDIYPELPDKDGYYAGWDVTELNNLHFDTVVTAVYEPYVTSISSCETRDNGRPVFYAEGQFDDNSEMNIELCESSKAESELLPSGKDALLNCFFNSDVNSKILEIWAVDIPKDGLESNEIRYLSPNGDTEHIRIYVKENGNWVNAESNIQGSYLSFYINDDQTEIAVVSTNSNWWIWLICIVLLVTLLLLIGYCVRKLPIKKRKPRKEKNTNQEPRRNAAKRKKKWLLISIIVILFLGIISVAGYKFIPGIMQDYHAYNLLKTWIEKPQQTMELSVISQLDGTDFDFSVVIEKSKVENQQMTKITRNGINLYYSEGVVFLENGTAYRFDETTPDYSELSSKIMELYRYVNTRVEDNHYYVTASDDDATELIKILLPEVASVVDVESMSIDLTEEDGNVSEIYFEAEGNTNEHTLSFSAKLTNCMDTEPISIPEEVKKAVISGEYEIAGTITSDMFILLSAWTELNNRNPLEANLTLQADCGPILLDETLSLQRWMENDIQINSLQKDEYLLYFTDNKICTADGNLIVDTPTIPLNSIQLLDFAYEVCMNSTMEYTADGKNGTYTINLDKEGIQNIVSSIAPETKNMDIIFETGTLSVSVNSGMIDCIEFQCAGRLDLLLTATDVSLGASMDFVTNNNINQIPDIVKNQLLE